MLKLFEAGTLFIQLHVEIIGISDYFALCIPQIGISESIAVEHWNIVGATYRRD